MHQSIQGNLWFAAIYNLAGMALAACGKLHPVAAALLMVGSSSVVAWRSLRPTDSCDQASPAASRLHLYPLAIHRWLVPLSLLFQIPLLAYLGHLGLVPLISSSVLILAFALMAHQLWASDPTPTRSQGPWRSIARMSLVMLGPGNLGMLLGWWVDAGFGPVMREAVCLCCQSRHYFQLGAGIPWMHVGMLGFGLPWMWRELPALTHLGGRPGSALVASLAMLFGMSFGADGLLKAFGPLHPHQFLIAYVGMTAGMLAAMDFICALLQAIAVAERSRGVDRGSTVDGS
jgi:hypothetical protein